MKMRRPENSGLKIRKKLRTLHFELRTLNFIPI